MTQSIHATACIEKGATIGKNVKIGPYCIIGPNVTIDDDCELKSHVIIDGKTTIGKKNIFYPFVSIGMPPQDLKFKGEDSRIEIGSGNSFREHVTVNPGTEGGGMLTKIGNNCLLMVATHVAHDCILGDHVILANNATLGGHVHVGDYAVIGGLSAVHQFVRIGHHAMIGGMSGIENDIIPYGSAMGERASLAGLNLIGLKRRGFSRDDIHGLRKAYKMIFSNDWGTLADRVKEASKEFKDNKEIMEVISFIKEESSRSICIPKYDELTATK